MAHDHDCSGEHGHADGHADVSEQSRVLKRLYTATGLCCTFLIIEVIGGYLSGSLAVLSDAAHLFADLASFGIAIVAAHLASLPTTDQHTFGLKRSESLAALLSMLSLALVSIGLAFEALRRLWHITSNTYDDQVDGKLMSVVAAIGVLVNIALAMVLGVEHHVHLPGAGHDHSHAHADGHARHSGNHLDDEEALAYHDHGHDADNSCIGHDHSHHHPKFLPPTTNPTTTTTPSASSHHDHHHHSHCDENSKFAHSDHSHYQALHADEVVPEPLQTAKQRNVNLEAAYLHVMGDLAQSVAVLIAGLVIWLKPEWRIIDPICTLFFCAFVFYSTLGVLRSSISVLLEEVPPNINWRDTFDAIAGVKGVERVHDLHIWSISHGKPTLSVHCMTKGNPELAMKRIYSVVKIRGIEHATIQVQSTGTNGSCITCTGNACDELRITDRSIMEPNTILPADNL